MTIFAGQEIVGQYNLSSNVAAPASESAVSALRIRFDALGKNITNLESVKLCVMTVENIKLFVGVYRTTSGFEKTFIQIPIIGQSFIDLVKNLNQTIGIEASVANNFFDASAISLVDTGFTNILNQVAYFSCGVSDSYSSVLNIKNSLQLFYTSVEPFSQQNNYNQSYGGYKSSNQVFYGYSLSESLGIYSDNAVFDFTSDNNNMSIINFQKAKFLQINDEIVEVKEWRGNTAFFANRHLFDTPLRMHPFGSVARLVTKNSNFDVNFGNSRKQYRCFALKNTHPTFTVKKIRIYSSLRDRNVNSQIKVAVQAPASNFYSGTSSSNGSTAFSVNALVNKYSTDYFKNAPIKFTTGLNANQVRLVKSFITSTGTLEIDTRLPYEISQGDSFTIDPQPSARMKSPFTKPTDVSVSNFLDLPTFDTALAFEDLQQNIGNSNLKPNEIIYLWVERSIGPQSDEYIDNRMSLSFSFSGI